jgi:ribonuclease E
MLINAQRPEELRIAIVRDRALENFQVDVAESGLTRGNIYRGTIANIQPALNAAFIDYGIERHGFLAIQDVVAEAYYHPPRGGHPRIEEVLERGKPIVVQVARDAIGQKGASLTTSLSLAGRYLVLTPFDDTRGVSRKVEDEDTRKQLKGIAANLDLPAGCGVIVRTNALDQNKTAINRDLAALLRLWKRVQAAATNGKGSRLLYSDQDLIVQALRDHLDSSIEEVLVDDDAAFQKAEAYVEAFMPRSKIRLARYEERLPLFSAFDLEPQIDSIYERRVELPSGGSIVIDATEALTAIDVNSGRSTRAATQEETALHTNLEAAAEVARQLRLRDIGGLVVVDFIDMRAGKNQRRVEKAMRDAMKADKARSSVGRISPNGLLEINRQRIQQALQVRTHRPCPTCEGTGRLASPEMVTLGLLRRIEARAASGLVQEVRIRLHPELADAMQNSRRQELAALEREFDLRIEVIAAAGLHRPDEQIEWLKRERAAAPQARPKPAPAALKPWDLALAAGAEPDQPPEPSASRQPSAAAAAGEAPGRRRRGPRERPERAPRADRPERVGPVPRREAGPAAAGAAGSIEEQEARRGRKRRRGGRKRKRGAAPGEENEEPRAAGHEVTPAGAEPAGSVEGVRAGQAGRSEAGARAAAGTGTGASAEAGPAGSDLLDGTGAVGGDATDGTQASGAASDATDGIRAAGAADGNEAAAASPAAPKRSRRRRRRRGGSGAAGTSGSATAGGPADAEHPADGEPSPRRLGTEDPRGAASWPAGEEGRKGGADGERPSSAGSGSAPRVPSPAPAAAGSPKAETALPAGREPDRE